MYMFSFFSGAELHSIRRKYDNDRIALGVFSVPQAGVLNAGVEINQGRFDTLAAFPLIVPAASYFYFLCDKSDAIPCNRIIETWCSLQPWNHLERPPKIR
jgi:hypothetical protein